ncbi:hypothetical protein JL720_15654 [Aureococcus anophagefferens]|nr:hypothetical protein JL720_15654 [Aureococcus anophagefferens]
MLRVLLVTAATSLELGRRDALRCLAASCATPAAVAGAAPIDAAPLNAWESYAAAKADLLALNVDGEDAAKVSAAGLAGLDRAARALPARSAGVRAFAKTVAFKSYVG